MQPYFSRYISIGGVEKNKWILQNVKVPYSICFTGERFSYTCTHYSAPPSNRSDADRIYQVRAFDDL